MYCYRQPVECSCMIETSEENILIVEALSLPVGILLFYYKIVHVVQNNE